MSDPAGSMYTTIVHEFQHMLQQNMKCIKLNGAEPETTFNEMFSVAAEDLAFMFFPQITLTTQAAINFMWDNINNYVYNGIECNSKMGYLYYGTGFSFAGWFMRRYGVVAMKNAANNDYLGLESIIQGINATKPAVTQTAESLLKDYAVACIRGMDEKPLENGKIFNAIAPVAATDAIYCTTQSYGYPLIAINLEGKNNSETLGFTQAVDPDVWSQKFTTTYPANKFGEIILTGFKKYCSNQVADLRPYGMMLHSIGRTKEAADVTLTFSSDSEPSASEKMYLVIY